MAPDAPRSIVEELVTIARRDLRAAELLASEPELFEVCASLADLGVAPRYPGWESGAGEVSSREAVASARAGLAILLPFTAIVPT
ncbi:MAG: hypothetical protein ACYC4P_13535 [Thermoanaerobaculia bacterium]